MAKIFVNYRRQQDGGWAAEAIATRLERELGADRIFLDVKNIRPAAEFAEVLRSELARAAALVVVMGEDWHKVQDKETGNKRIAEEDDWVREEIRTALQRKIPIFILLLETAELPRKDWVPEDIRAFLGTQATRIRQATVDADLRPVLDELAARIGIARPGAASAGRPRSGPPSRFGELPARARTLAASRAPIVLAIEEAGARIKEQELLAAERHLTVTLRGEHAGALRSIQAHLGDAASVDTVIDLGLEAWRTLTAAAPRLEDLLRQVAAAEDKEGHPQPIAWTGHLDLLASIHRAILIACADDGEGGASFLTIAHGGHYFHPLSTGASPRSMQRRVGDGQQQVGLGRLELAASDDGALRAIDAALEREVVLVSADHVGEAVRQIAGQLPRQPTSPTRVVLALGPAAVEASTIDAALAVVPCVSVGGPGLRAPQVLRELDRALAAALETQAVPVIVARLRGDLVVEQLSRPPEAVELPVLRDALGWSTWSWVGRPLFADEFGAVPRAAYPHLMDLRDVATRDWYYERFADIPEPYQTSALTARDPGRRFHLYLSGAGGTGKSCFLRFIYETLEINNPDVLPVWYKVHAPSSEWKEVEAQIKAEVRAAIERRPELAGGGLLSAADERKELGNFLLDLLEKLRLRSGGVDQIVLFIDQLERTFESGANPELQRLTTISEKIVHLLERVGVDKGIRVFLASRKQYLADFLSSFEKAEKIKLHFNVLRTFSVEKEGAAFVHRIVGWCNANKLTATTVHVDDAAAQLLATRERGHPLNMMLALIQLLSRSDLPEEIGEATIEALRPWAQRFHVDEALMGKDELDWYFFLAMAHAQTEIVRREEVLWRLSLVSPELARRTKELGPPGVLERLWLLGHLGRTMHPRRHGGDPARFLEFFHANLRDHLITNVMNRADEPAAPLPRGSRLDRRGMPRAWRALDRLREIARDWEQLQQPLPREDIGVLMDFKELFTERMQIQRGGRAVEVESFYLLFMRDVEDRREGAFQAAKECLAYSALVHDVHGRWAFRTLFPSVAPGPERDGGRALPPHERSAPFDDSQVGCCRRWLRPTRADSQSRLRIFHYLVELRDPHANRLLAELAFDPSADDEPWQQLAGILADPLVAATHRSAFLAHAVQHLLDEGVAFPADNWHTERFGAFLVASCTSERHEVTHLLETLPQEVALLGDRRVELAMQALADPARIDRWLGALAAAAGPATTGGELEPGAEVELRLGDGLAAHLDRDTLARWLEQVAARLDVPLPRVVVSRAEVSGHRRTEEVHAPPPPGFELQLLIRGRLIGLGRFFPDRIQTLTRDWGGADAEGAIPCFHEGLWEPVRWVEERVLDAARWRHRRWTLDQAVTDWLEELLRRFIEHVFSYDDVHLYLARVAPRARAAADLQALANVLHPIWRVLARLVLERVPLAERNADLLIRLIELVRESETFDVALMTVRLREHVSGDLCRAFADSANQLVVLLLDLADEQWLASKLNKTPIRLAFDQLTPEETLRMVAAVRGRFEEVAREDHAAPVLVCEDYLRAPLFELLQRFDPRIFVLSYTELSPDVRLTSRGVLRRFSPAGGSA